MAISFDGYHGTSLNCAEQIKNSNYNLSIGDQEWLGDGVYFYVSGINSKPSELAEKWAIAQAWNPTTKSHSYEDLSILKSTIHVKEENFLDLTIEDGVEIFTYCAEKYLSKIKSIGKSVKYDDGILINFLRNEKILPIDVVKGNFYIKFAKERIQKINLRTNNCTICSVYDPVKNIQTIEIVKTSKITDYETQ